jgi:hypothetical protein
MVKFNRTVADQTPVSQPPLDTPISDRSENERRQGQLDAS